MLKIIFSCLVILSSFNVVAEEDHHEEHKEEHKKEHHDEHAEKLDGFKLNAKSFKTFDIKLIDVNPGKVIVPREAIYKGLNEVNLYRLRGELYKRIDFKILSQTKSEVTVASDDLAKGDKIVIQGIGFLRMAEIAASGGLSDSHSH